MDADEFYKTAMEPGFMDEMVFQIHAANPKNPGTFSKEGVENTVDLMQSFIIARLMGRWKRTGKPPKEMKMHLKIEWVTDDDIADGWLPYFDADIRGNGLTQVDGQNRIPRNKGTT